MTDAPNRPVYQRGQFRHAECGKPIECIDIARHLDFNLGSVIKHIWRAGLLESSSLTDLRKARWYLDDEIRELEAAEQEGKRPWD